VYWRQARWRDHQRRETTIGEAFARSAKRISAAVPCGTATCPPELSSERIRDRFCGARARGQSGLCDIYGAPLWAWASLCHVARQQAGAFLHKLALNTSASHACPKPDYRTAKSLTCSRTLRPILHRMRRSAGSSCAGNGSKLAQGAYRAFEEFTSLPAPARARRQDPVPARVKQAFFIQRGPPPTKAACCHTATSSNGTWYATAVISHRFANGVSDL